MDRAIKIINGIMEFCVWGLIFFLPFSKAGVEIFLHIALCAWLVKRFIIGKKMYRDQPNVKSFFNGFRLAPTKLNGMIYALAAASFISVMFGVNLRLGFEGIFGKLYSYLFIFFLTVETLTKYDPRQGDPARLCPEVFKRIVGVFIFSVILIFIDGWFQFFTGKDFMRGFSSFGINRPRLRASFNNPNNFAAWLIAVVPVVIVALPAQLKNFGILNKRVIKIVCLVVSLSGIVLLARTYSRSAWVGFLAGMFLFGVAGAISGIKRIRLLSGSIIVFLIISLAGGVVFIKPVL